MEKEIIIVLLDELYDNIQNMREEEATDLKTILHLIYETKIKIVKG